MAQSKLLVNSLTEAFQVIRNMSVRQGWTVTELSLATGEIAKFSVTVGNLTVVFTHLLTAPGTVFGFYGTYVTLAPTGISITGSRLGEVSTIRAGVWDNTAWPKQMFISTTNTPNFFICGLWISDDEPIQWLAFGELTQYSTWVGGEWFYGSTPLLPDNSWAYNQYGPLFQTGSNYSDLPKTSDLYCGIYGGWSTTLPDTINEFSSWPKRPNHLLISSTDYGSAVVVQVDLPLKLIPYRVAITTPSPLAGAAIADSDMVGVLSSAPTTTLSGIIVAESSMVGGVSSSQENSRVHAIGEVSAIKGVNLNYRKPGTVVRLDTGNWIVFPWADRLLTVSGGGGYATISQYSFAIKYEGP